MAVRFVDQVGVDLVAHDQQAGLERYFGDRRQLLRREDSPRRVVRVTQKQQPAAPIDRLLECRLGEPKAVAAVGEGCIDNYSTARLDGPTKRVIDRIGNDDPVAGSSEGHDCRRHPLHDIKDHTTVCRRRLPTLPLR